MKLCKLLVHNKSFCVEDLVINPKDFPSLKKGDIVEIYHPEDEFSRLLLQITTFKEDLQGRDAVSIEQSIASTFQLRKYADVYLNVVDPGTVSLDSVEMTYKDQYLGRSEMWRLKNSLVNTCVYLNKKIEFCGGSARCQVYEMWSSGDRVACGVITESTKIVFRSSTSMVYLFLQMSSEMWDFDIHGDLYFEKAVNGFMADLFQKWKKHGSNHEVTIVLFSRTFYKAHNLEEFPSFMRDCLQQDYKGRFYEDFYRVAVQNERYDDWTHILVELRRLFSDYLRSVLEYHVRPDVTIPPAINSTAAQGNFLEVLNMSLNVFEKHYLERSFDRTGQLSVVITPGVGVFEVDRELTNVTKQRVIDNGVGSDLVCLGEQPLHAVPLLKFRNKDVGMAPDDYSMPHWINLSFYSSNKKAGFSNFIPRIKLPPRKNKMLVSTTSVTESIRSKTEEEEHPPLSNPALDYDSYDAQVFALPNSNVKNILAIKKTSVSALETGSKMPVKADSKVMKRKLSDPHIHLSTDPKVANPRTPAITIPLKYHKETSPTLHTSAVFPADNSKHGEQADEDGSSPSYPTEESPQSPMSPSSLTGRPGSRGSIGPLIIHRPGRALINPFDPSHIIIKLTSNRRRWAHIFPKGPTGVLIQQHHYQAAPAVMGPDDHEPDCAFISRLPRGSCTDQCKPKPRPNILTLTGGLGTQTVSKKSLTFLWGCTGEQEWTPALTTGVDWKSLTIPACFPITTDYFPDEVCLIRDYVLSEYNLLPDDVNADFAQQRVIYRKPLTTQEVFRELISQRLTQGFQIVLTGEGSESSHVQSSVSILNSRSQEGCPSVEYKLSIGRLFHKITLSGSEIRVTRYRPRHPYPPFNFHYRYRFQAPDHDNYDVSWVSFNTEKLENFNWNYLDHYICTRGDTDFALLENLKYWRFRVYLIPQSQANKKILDGAEHCNIYTELSLEEQLANTEGFLRFIEAWVNKMRRPPTQKKHRPDLSSLNMPSPLNRRRHSTGILHLQSSVVGNSPFRERLGSNRLPEKPRPRSGSKVMDRGRISPAGDVIPIPNNNEEHDNESEQAQCVILKEGASHKDIIDAMKHPTGGVGFLSPHPSLPSNTFVSSDAVSWIQNHVEGINTYQKAVTTFQEMLKERLICHASGDFSQGFIVGFYLYYVVKMSKEEKGDDPVGDIQGFENEWAEVEVESAAPPPPLPSFLLQHLPPPCSQVEQKGPMHKEAHLEIDAQNKSDRVEWGHAKYQSVYRPDRAFEMMVKWVAASGPIVADLILFWARKAQACGLQMIPTPADPFALPYSLKSDPLRGPLFIQLDTECLMGTKSYLFEEFGEDTWAQRLVLFQESIAISFGFIACAVEGNQHQHKQYIHLSGNVFLLIPSLPCEHNVSTCSSSRSRPVKKYALAETIPASPHHEYITRHVGHHTRSHDTRIGFLWSWNHMVSRRWRLGSFNATCDEAFQNKLLNDFKEFCSNGKNRLKTYWDESWKKIINPVQENAIS